MQGTPCQRSAVEPDSAPELDEPFSPYGAAALKKLGRRRWQKMPARVTRIDSAAGILGDHRLWEWGDVP